VTDHVVVGDRVLLDISFRAAQARLRILARDGVLLRASEEVYSGDPQLRGPDGVCACPPARTAGPAGRSAPRRSLGDDKP
jgi:hypothetical protein